MLNIDNQNFQEKLALLRKATRAEEGADQKKSKKELKKRSRKIITAFFFLTVFACIAVFSFSEAPRFFHSIVSPIVITDDKPAKGFDPSPVINEVENITKNVRGQWGFYVYELISGKEYGKNETVSFPAASLMKLPVILSMYIKNNEEVFDLDEKYKLLDKDKIGGAGVLQSKPAGSNYSFRELVGLMGKYSDNTAYGVTVNKLGRSVIQEVISQLGMKKTSIVDHETTPYDIGLLLRKLYRNEVVRSEQKEEILNALTNTIYEQWIPAGIPDEIKVSHKIGKDIGVFADGGIVFGPRPFVLVIMSKDAREADADIVIPEVARIIWNFENID